MVDDKIMDSKKFTDFLSYEFNAIAIATMLSLGFGMLEEYNIITENKDDKELEILLSLLGRIKGYKKISDNQYSFITKNKILDKFSK